MSTLDVRYKTLENLEQEFAVIKTRYAIVNNDMDLFKSLLPTITAIKLEDFTGTKKNIEETLSLALYDAAYNGRANMLDLLLGSGLITDKADQRTAIRTAVIYAHTTSVKAFLKHNIPKENLNGLLELAAVRRTGMAKALLEYGVGTREEKNKALISAVYFGKYESAKLLLEYGAEPNTIRNLPTRLAASKENKPMLNLLYKYGAERLKPNAVYDITDAELYYSGINIDQSDMDREMYPFEHDWNIFYDSVKGNSQKPIANIYYTLSPDYTEKEAFLDFEKFQTAFIEATDTYGANNVKAEVLSDSAKIEQFVYITELGPETNRLMEAIYEKDIDKIRTAL